MLQKINDTPFFIQHQNCTLPFKQEHNALESIYALLYQNQLLYHVSQWCAGADVAQWSMRHPIITNSLEICCLRRQQLSPAADKRTPTLTDRCGSHWSAVYKLIHEILMLLLTYMRVARLVHIVVTAFHQSPPLGYLKQNFHCEKNLKQDHNFGLSFYS